MNTFNTLSNKFHVGVRWNFAGSIIYESIKALHNFFLFSLIDNTTYGLLGSTFSIIYLSSKLADFGATSSLPPFFNHITRNKQTFLRIMGKHYLLPHLPLVLIVAIASTATYTHQFASTQLTTLIIPIIISLEAVRYFLRLFLNAAFKGKAVVVIEITLFINFIALIWIPHLIFHTPLTITNILIPHVIDSFLCVGLFLIVLAKFYFALPGEPTSASQKHPSPSLSLKRMTTTKATNYALRMSRDLFTSNFLTPLLALKCGLGQAGIFYLATIIVNAIQSTIKMSIHYPASGLLSQLKESPLVTKKAAFTLLCQKLTKLITPIIIFLAFNHKLFLGGLRGERPSFFSSFLPSMTTTTIAIALTFLLISLIESFFILYEQFYVIEEASTRLFMFKVLEFVLFYVFVIKSTSTSIITLITTIATIKLFSFGLTTLNAFTRWRLTPTIKPSFKAIIGWVIVSLLFSLFF